MTTLDGVERALDPDTAMVCDAEGPSGIAGIMGGQISEVSDKTHACPDGDGHMGRPQHPRDVEAARPAVRGERPLREAAPPRPGDRRPAAGRAFDGRAVRSADGPPDDRRLSGSRCHRRPCRCALPASRSCWASASRWTSPPRSSSGSGSTWALPATRWTWACRRSATSTSSARRTWSRRWPGSTGSTSLPTTLPAREGAVGRLTGAQRLDGASSRTRCATAACTRWSAGASPRRRTIERLRLADAPVLRLSNPLSEDQSVMRPLLLPGLLDAARRNAAYDRAGAGYFESAHVYSPSGALDAPDGSPKGALPADEHHHVAALVAGDFYAAKGVLEGLLETCACRSPSHRASAPSCTRAGPQPCTRAARARSGGSASCIHWSRASGICRAARRSSWTWTRSRRSWMRRPGTGRFRRSRQSSRTSPWSWRMTCPPAMWSRPCGRAAASCSSVCLLLSGRARTSTMRRSLGAS